MSPETLTSADNGSICGGVPLATHDDVVKDPTLFFNTLRSFHFARRTKFLQAPVIGGKELNLHVLYVEVTKRGGYHEVVRDKKWREISGVLDLSATTTSASYVLKKHYLSLLHPYELLYFFRNPGPDDVQVVGTIDAKFECGYLVSVKLGNQTLNGVLYHPTRPPTLTSAIVPHASLSHQRGRRGRRRRRLGDPNRPKPNRSGYNFFFAERHSMLKSLYPNREREFTKMIGESWNGLSAEERVVYQNYGMKDKERYQREMEEYKERLKMEQTLQT